MFISDNLTGQRLRGEARGLLKKKFKEITLATYFFNQTGNYISPKGKLKRKFPRNMTEATNCTGEAEAVTNVTHRMTLARRLRCGGLESVGDQLKKN